MGGRALDLHEAANAEILRFIWFTDLSARDTPERYTGKWTRTQIPLALKIVYTKYSKIRGGNEGKKTSKIYFIWSQR